MTSESFAGHLAALDSSSLIALLLARPDVLVEPVPRGFGQLAQRLEGPDSLVAAMWALNRDTVRVGQAVAALAGSAAVSGLAGLLGAPEDAVRAGVDDLCGRGLAWVDPGGAVRLPQRLHDHWSAGIGDARPVEKIARTVLAEELQAAVAAFGAPADGLRKPELIARLAELMSDPRRLATTVAALPAPMKDRLNQFRRSPDAGYYPYATFDGGRRRAGVIEPTEALVAAGLLLRANRQPELPREVALAAWLDEQDLVLTGQPDIPRPSVDQATLLSAAQAAAQNAVRAVTALLDEAAAAPVAALKKGGVGGRERARLAKVLSMPADDLPLWIDLAYAAGLLALADAGYAPTSGFGEWRAAPPSRQWAALATAWLSLEHAPTSRETAGDKDVPPPLPLASGAGRIRRALLHAAGSGRSVRLAGKAIDWFCPLHGYGALRAVKVAAAIGEAELLGVVAVDVLSGLGEHLLAAQSAAGGTTPGDTVAAAALAVDGQTADDLARRCAGLLPAASSSLVLQSDLTAVVSGPPSAAVSQLLRDAAVAESRGAAGTWRFTPSSVRAALDAGWAAADLLAALHDASEHAVPQPLEYLVTDVGRRHGHVRVRGMRSCVLSDEASTTEILHTRSLAKLNLSRLAPTVLASPLDLDTVLAELRRAGFYPIAEDATGTVIVPTRHEHQASPRRPTTTTTTTRSAPRRLSPAELARQLHTDPGGDATPDSGVAKQLAQLNTRLNDAELALLSDAVQHRHDVVIAYRDNNGTRTVRQIQPNEFYGKWLDSWCRLREAQRDFSVASIESVSPAS